MSEKSIRPVALLIEVNFQTGERAGGINPRDPKLPCRGWQDVDEGWEIRLVEDDRDLSQYEGVGGVTVLRGKSNINEAIEKASKPRYEISSEFLMLEHMKEKGISMDYLVDRSKNPQDVLKDLYEKGVAGIGKTTPTRL